MPRLSAVLALLLLAPATAAAAGADVDDRYASAYRKALDARDLLERDPSVAKRGLEVAAQDLRTLTSEEPDYAPARFGLGVVLRALGRCADGEAEFDRYLDLISRDPDLAPLSGRVDRERENWPCDGPGGDSERAARTENRDDGPRAGDGRRDDPGGRGTGSADASTGNRPADRFADDRDSEDGSRSASALAEPAPAGRGEEPGAADRMAPRGAGEDDEPAGTASRDGTGAQEEDPGAGRGGDRPEDRSASGAVRARRGGPSAGGLLAGGIVLNVAALGADALGAWFAWRNYTIRLASSWESGLDAGGDYDLPSLLNQNIGLTIVSFAGAAVMHATGIGLLVSSGRRRNVNASAVVVPGDDGLPMGLVSLRF